MKDMMKRFWNEEEGFGTVELVILIGVLVAIALIFRKAVIKFVNNLISKFFNSGKAPGLDEDIGTNTGG